MSILEISAKLYQVRFHPDNGSARYTACFQLYVDGDKGFLYSLIGKDFYRALPEYAEEIMKRTGINSVEAYMTPTHAKAMLRLLGKKFDASIIDEGLHSGRKMVWILFKRKESGEG